MRELERRLVEDVRILRTRDPVGAIYLLVPSRFLGVHLRRRIARALGGILNLHALTLPDLADRVAGLPLALAGRRALPPAGDRLLVGRAIRAAIPASDGYFSAVSTARNLPAAVLRTLLDLKKAGVTPDALDASAPASPHAPKIRELAACYRSTEGALAAHGYYDASDLMAEAARLILAEPSRLGAAAVSVVGFTELNPLEQRLIAACGRRAVLTMYPADAAACLPPSAEAIEIVAAPGEEREVREIARVILHHAASGGRFEDVGVLLRQPDAYRAAIRDVFGGAGLPYTWGVAPTLRETRTGRSLLLLLEARRADFSRAAVMEFLTFADLVQGPGVSPAEWDRLSREAGIVRGAEAWRDRLERLGRTLGPAGQPENEPDEAYTTRTRDRDALVALHRTVGLLIRALARLPLEGRISDLAQALASGFRRLLARTDEADQALGLLRSLRGLSALDAGVTLDEFGVILETALTSPTDPGPEERVGKVFVGELTQSLGLDFPVTIIPGLVEGGFPPVARQDPILLDDERRRFFGLPLSEARRDLERLHFRLAVGSGARRLVLTYPRVEAESGRIRVPSFFLLDLLEQVTGQRHDFASLEGFPRHRRVALHPAPESARDAPLDEREWLITRAVAARGRPDGVLRQLPAARRGWTAIQARERAPILTPYDGLLSDGVDLGEEPLAPTWLEAYATCPFKYFLGRVLRVDAVEEPGQIHTIGAAERGSLVHAVLEQAFRRLQEMGALPITPERLLQARETLDATLDEAFEAAERRGVTGLPALWAGEQARLRAELRAALETEVDGAAEWVPSLFEVPFGMPWLEAALPAVTYALPDGTTLHLRGKVDRIDRSCDGTRARVIDYKTGRPRGSRSPDRMAQGRALQLPLYRLAAEALLAARGERVSVEEAQYYHLIGRDAGARVRFTRQGWEVRRGDFDRVLMLLVEGIRTGRFFARPESCSGRYPCDYDLACGAERRRWAEAKAADPAVVRHDELESIE